MEIISNATGRVRYVDDRRKFALVDMIVPHSGSILVPATVIKDFGTSLSRGDLCYLADLCATPRGWQACRIVKIHTEGTDSHGV